MFACLTIVQLSPNHAFIACDEYLKCFKVLTLEGIVIMCMFTLNKGSIHNLPFHKFKASRSGYRRIFCSSWMRGILKLSILERIGRDLVSCN